MVAFSANAKRRAIGDDAAATGIAVYPLALIVRYGFNTAQTIGFGMIAGIANADRGIAADNRALSVIGTVLIVTDRRYIVGNTGGGSSCIETFSANANRLAIGDSADATGIAVYPLAFVANHIFNTAQTIGFGMIAGITNADRGIATDKRALPVFRTALTVTVRRNVIHHTFAGTRGHDQ